MVTNRPFIEINSRRIGRGHPTYIVAEMSANHNHSFDRAVEIIREAKKVGADAIKLQTYTPDTLTINSENEPFQIPKGNTWERQTLYELYKKAYTPWEWQPKLKEVADEIGIDLFSTPFDSTAVEFLEEMDVPAYKIASFEVVDIPLIEQIAKAGKPIIMSTGLALLSEIDEAVKAAREAGAEQIALLKCTSTYPAPPEEMNLATIPHLSRTFNVPAGLSDHTFGTAVSLGGVALGACIIEKHFTLSRSDPGPDSAFSLEPSELSELVKGIRSVEKAIGTVNYEVTAREENNRCFRRSLFIVKDMKAGEIFAQENVRSIRPGYGLPPRYFPKILGRSAARDIERGTPMDWDLVAGKASDL